MGSRWGNPFPIRPERPLEEVLRLFTEHLHSSPELLAGLGDLVGKELGCWCKPNPCHGDILVEECKRWLASDRIHHVDGSVFDAPNSVALAHCVSADLAMSSGIAVQFAKRWPDIRSGFVGSKPGSLHAHVSARGPIFNLITKERFDDKPSWEDFRNSVVALKNKMIELEMRTVAVPELGSGRDQLDLNKVIKTLREVLVEAGIGVIMYHLPREDKSTALAEAEIEAERAGKDELKTLKTNRNVEKRVSFKLSNNVTKEIAPPSIPGLVLEAAPSKKKRKKKKKSVSDELAEVGLTSAVESDRHNDNLGERLRKLHKQLGKLEMGEKRLESVDEAETGKFERDERRRELRQEINTLELRLHNFN